MTGPARASLAAFRTPTVRLQLNGAVLFVGNSAPQGACSALFPMVRSGMKHAPQQGVTSAIRREGVKMVREPDLAEYLAEIRKQVCSRCIERPPGGPPCAPLRKICGIEEHLPELVEAIHKVQSGWIGPYLDYNRRTICARCPQLGSGICPCAMDYLAVLLVQ